MPKDAFCNCPACESGLEPRSREHFRVWALDLELDNGSEWVVEEFFLDWAEDYFRGTPENWLLVPEGNSKTTSLAGFAVYLLEHRAKAGIPWAASSRDQAEIGYRQAEGFVLGSLRLKKKLKCQEGYRRIKNLENGGRIQVFAADDKTGDGIIPTDAFLDELHRHKNMRLYRTWAGKLGKRGGQLATISTAGEPGGEFETTREAIRQSVPEIERRPGFVRCRSERISFHEWALEDGGDPSDMAAVKRCNPFSAITEATLAEKFATPTMTPQHWGRFVCNVPMRASSAAIQELEWANAYWDGEIPANVEVWLGMDVGFRWDSTAIVPLWWKSEDFRVLGETSIIESPRDGSSTNPALIKRAITEYTQRYRVTTVVMDPNRAEDISHWLSDELGLAVIERSQTSKPQGEDYERFMEALRQGWLRHTGDQGLKAHALNAISYLLPDGGAKFRRPVEARTTDKQDERVIDALVAAAMVHSVRCEPGEPNYRFVGF